MAYQESNITAITDIPQLVGDFAASVGWDVSGLPNEPVLTRPGGSIGFQVVASISGFDHLLRCVVSGGGITSEARFLSPKLGGTVATPVVSIPSKLHLFGSLTPEPFIAVVVEYGFNSYRHMYIGNLEKLGSYDGGEVISATYAHTEGDNNTTTIGYRNHKYLFTARNQLLSAAQSGGVRVVHAENPTPWRRFRGTTHFQPMTDFDNATVLGGFGDDINDGYLARGKSAYAGAQILVPINLYATMPITGNTLFVPLGRPAGVRMVHMQDLDPGHSFLLGTQTWRCFPALRKSEATSFQQPVGSWPLDETSHWVGYAYPEN